MRILILALFLYFSTVNAEPKCHSVEFMSCLDYGKDYLNSLPKGSLPETREEVDGFCQMLDDVLKCWEGFKTQCMTPIQRELEALVLEGVRGFKDEYCASGSPKAGKYMEHASCLNKVALNDNTRKSINYVLTVFEMMLTKPEDGSIALICCGVNRIYDEIKDDATKTCGAEAADFGEEIISSVISTLPKALCGGFDPKTEECQKVKLGDDVKPTGAAKDNKIYQFVVDFFHNFIPE